MSSTASIAPAPATTPALRRYVALVGAGTGLGFTLGSVGFTRFDEVHAMFVLEDLRLFFVFVGAAVLTAFGFLLPRLRALPCKTMHRGTIPGAILFGIGWALCGACPGVIFAQLGEGQWHAVVITAGLVAGVLLQRTLQRRAPQWGPPR